MKVLSLIESFLHGGAETVATDLAVGLRGHQHRLAHFATENGGAPHVPFVAALHEAGVTVLDVHWDPEIDGAADRVLSGGWIPDVVLIHWWGHDPWAQWLAAIRRRAGSRAVRSICVLHAPGLDAPTGHDRYVLVSESQRPQVRAIPTDRVSVIPNGVDVERFRLTTPRPGGNGTFVVGRLSNLHPHKVPPDFVDTALSWGVPDARFVIAGDGALRDALIRDARRAGAADRFEFPGYVPREQVPKVLSGFDVFCYATPEVECHPLVLLEAAAAGLPVVAEARGGVPGIVEHEVSGMLAASADEMGAALRRLRSDEGLRRRLGEGGRRIATDHSLGRQLSAYDAELRSVATEEAGA